MAGKGKGKSGSPEIRNSKARHEYLILDTWEAGIKLVGTEIKSVRMGRAQITEAFCRIDDNNIPTLYHANIDEYSHGTDSNHAPRRPRVLLLKAKEIRKIRKELETGGLALVPLRLYFKEALLKCEIALAKGKKLVDKREDVKRKTELREADRAVSMRRQ